MLFQQVVGLVCCLSLVLAKTHTFNFTASYITANPDGVKDKKVISFNKQWPPPEIHINKGDRVELYLTNGLETKNTSLHFHGLFQNGSNFMDGPEWVTQCPIQPGDTYLYNFTVDQVGSYWYHSHSGAQYGDGMRGAFIVHDDKEPFKYDEEKVITISEIYHDQYYDIFGEFLNRYNPTGAEPIPQNLLLNDTANSTIYFEPKKTYLLRFINVGLFVSQYLYIEDHELTIVEIDGVYVEPFKASHLYMTVGQRYAVLVTAKDHKDKNYAIVQGFDDTMLDVIPDDLRLNATSYLVYDDEKPLPKEYKINDLAFNDYDLTPLDKEELYDDYDYQITLDVVMDNLGDGVNYAFFNNITYTHPVTPTIITALTASKEHVTNPRIYGSNINAFVLQPNEIVEVVVNNHDDGRHPFHLHGHTFQVIQKSKSFDDEPVPYDENDHEPFPKYPIRRDTVNLEPNGHIVLRFKTDNPGIWFFHCHVDWHLEQGLAAVFIEDPLSLQNQKPPQDFYDNCIASGIPIEGNAAGNKDFFNMTGENLQSQPLPEGFTLKGYLAFAISTFAGLYGLWSIIQYGLEDSVQYDEKIFNNLEKILHENNLIQEADQVAADAEVNEHTHLSRGEE
ncbi:putative secreted protein [Wickerhamomyces ciferrii]|uniref:Secreted protein n=1 Tax=Wickerhamomyces ciferrii (strain ATCC 14091 / BCRC 22168 / CBS 111 / JCM 3599 / NBRC 0793 / NRRL Y-1031 F-60-10) TaxID=1206466 RepID=K0KEA4_WICCF|nr:uncharacterized protein BN7_783 [Wickerhamomyces ciferrii]CCH41246.1 putative secreted protein [Wickerhamomyces ciferrii]